MTMCKQCSDDISPKRAALGYRLCKSCGDRQARQLRMGWCIAPLNKSNYILVTNKDDLKGLNPKRLGE